MINKYTDSAGIASVVAIAIGSASPLAAQDTNDDALRLKPASQWQLNHADDSCRLARVFGEGDQRVIFYIERYGLGKNFSMLAAGKPLKGRERYNYAYTIFGPDLTEQKRSLTLGNLGEVEPALIFSNIHFGAVGQRVTPTMEQKIEWISLRRRSRDPVVLETGSLGKPMEAMRKCVGTLLTGWGIDLEKHSNLAHLPKPLTSYKKWIKPSDYPTGKLRKGEQGIVSFRLSVDKTGVPTACHIQQATKPKGFDDIVCGKLMKRARFTPAMTKDGEAIASYWRNTVRFTMQR